ncbi:MAG: Asp-tRNA(Asn)/Glu-tRNA(Gln) amidotransferase subunit GatC [Candidatus Paceibacterota bacterium]|jgi:aspartyl-tRNA(Asn)/glutamyl-tRNA(Gln) amidotransferase subunit C
MLTIDDINNLARLARIEISEDEKAKLQKDMESILGYVSQITSLATKEEGATPNTDLINVMREDVATHESGEYKDAILANAPKREGDYFSVKPIFEDR